jgi:hypothetical protein
MLLVWTNRTLLLQSILKPNRSFCAASKWAALKGRFLQVPIRTQLAWLFILAIPTACVAWTVTHEDIFREPREYCQRRSRRDRTVLSRKFFFLLTCEYCFSHYVALVFLGIARFQLLYADWRGYLLALFALVWVANIYMSIYNRLRLDIRQQRIEIEAEEEEVQERKAA